MSNLFDIDIFLPTRLRRAFNGWLKGLVAGQHFSRVLNLACGHDIDKEGATYSSYFDCNEIVRVDIAVETKYGSKEVKYSGGLVCQNPVDIIASAENLPFDDNYFDFVFCNWAFYYMDREKALFQINRVLKNNGLCFISYYSKEESFMAESRLMLEKVFVISAFARLNLEQHLDGREGFAEAIWGTKI